MPAADAVLAGMLEHPTWTHRQAALLAISAMAEGCNEDMEQRLPNIVPYAPPVRGAHSGGSSVERLTPRLAHFLGLDTTFVQPHCAIRQ